MTGDKIRKIMNRVFPVVVMGLMLFCGVCDFKGSVLPLYV